MSTTFHAFAEFEPKHGTVRGSQPFQLYVITHRARAVLDAYSAEQIHDIASKIALQAVEWTDDYIERNRENFIEFAIERGEWPLAYLPKEQRHAAGLRELLENWPADADEPSPLEGLADDIRVFDTLDSNDPADFAVLALWQVAESLRYFRFDPRFPFAFQSLQPGQVADAAERAMEALEAICQAEKLAHVNSSRISLAVKAAEARHHENRLMKQEVWDWCRDNLSNYPSIDAAAEDIAGQLVPVKFRTAQKWISQYRREHTASAHGVRRTGDGG